MSLSECLLFSGERATTSVHISAEARRLCSGIRHGVHYPVCGSANACRLWDCVTSWVGTARWQSSRAL